MDKLTYLNLKSSYENGIKRNNGTAIVFLVLAIFFMVFAVFFLICLIAFAGSPYSEPYYITIWLVDFLMFAVFGIACFIVRSAVFIRKRNNYQVLLRNLLAKGYDEPKKVAPKKKATPKKRTPKKKKVVEEEEYKPEDDPMSIHYIPPSQR